MGFVLAFIWWLIVFSPIGFGRAFDVIIGGDDLRNTFNTVFVVVLTVDGIGAIVCFFFAVVKILQDWLHRLTGKAVPVATSAASVKRLLEEASIESERTPPERAS